MPAGEVTPSQSWEIVDPCGFRVTPHDVTAVLVVSVIVTLAQ